MDKKIDLRRADFEAMHPIAKLFGFDDEVKMYVGDSVDAINSQWTTWCACIGMVHLEVEEAKAQAVPEVINVGNELQSWVAVWSFKARHDHEDYIVVDANLLAEKIEKLTGANA